MPRRPTKRYTSFFAAAVAYTSAAGALRAADPQPPRGPETPAGRPAAEPSAMSRAPLNPAANDTALQFQKNGGSLMRASLATLPPEQDPSHQMRDVSFFAIPRAEPKTIRKHDLISVVVREESSFTSQGTTDVKRESDIDAHVDQFIKLKLSNFAIQGGAQGAASPAVQVTGNRAFKGEGTVDRSDSMTARMTAEVVDVKPNGTLVLQARKTIKTDEEEQSFILTGTCRVEDLVADNSVLSTQLYDLRLEKNTKGAVTSATNQGFIHKLLNFLNPF